MNDGKTYQESGGFLGYTAKDVEGKRQGTDIPALLCKRHYNLADVLGFPHIAKCAHHLPNGKYLMRKWFEYPILEAPHHFTK